MSEFDWIDRYLRPLATAPGAHNLKNDVATLSDSVGATIATMDTIVEGVHFLSSDPIETVGKKLLRVNVSDILCKGALPKDALLSVALPNDFTEESFATFCRGLGADLVEWGVTLLGGDTVRTPGPLTLTITLTGTCLAAGPVERSGAQPGDVLCVTGEIGHGGLGLTDAKAGRPSTHADHYRVPRLPGVEVADLVACFASASIDVSDGLLSDTALIAEQSRVAVSLQLSDVPYAAPVSTAEDAINLATSGDDYQTLFTVPPSDLEACLERADESGLSVTVIGQVRTGSEVELRFQDEIFETPTRSGYSH
ncbi:thiamine-phosphate kinase [Henriciella marina]|uniref:thiamine-phosphate kinase n=1 Tax=Henriciella marina TaxID=453851 RepID=UPI00036DD34A|nr:thiamine-phosphate kinase [Henriciella marina]